MSTHQPTFEELLFEAAAHRTDAVERAAFLDEACRNNSALRARLDLLLEGHFAAEGFLTQVPGSSAPALPIAQPSETPAQMLGRYKLLEKIGEGGFGEVWMAEQREPIKRRVALKIIKLGMDSRQVVARFEAERQALAMMDHSNIAKIFDAGTTGAEGTQFEISNFKFQISTGRPYFVMELVRGIKITDYCDQNQLTTRERLDLFIKVCQAIQHAHQKGIIHRDIKPSNILVTLLDGVPTPKIIDFGIAKATQGELTDKTLFTHFQQFIGTPAYISPEQAEMSGSDVDTRSDIYSLGVLIYELLVGRTPFAAEDMMKGGLDSMRQMIRTQEPPRPSTKLKTLPAPELTTTAERRRTDPVRLTHFLRGDLDWIVLKCLEKDRARRYDTANGLAADIQRYLANEPVLARAPSAAYRLQKAWQRNKLAFTAVALIVLVVMFGVGAVIFVQHGANQDYRERLYVSEIGRAGLAWQAGQSSQILSLLDRCPSDLRRWEWTFLRQQADRWESTTFLATTNLVEAVLSADGRLIAVAAGNVIQIRDFPGGGWIRNLPFKADWDFPFAVSPRDQLLATLDGETGALTIWNMRSGERVAAMNHGEPGRAVGWSSDGRRLVSGGGKMIRFWDAGTGREERAFSAVSPVRSMAFAPDDRTLAVGTAESGAQLYDLSTGIMKRAMRVQGWVIRLKFSPDGRKLAMSNRTLGGHEHDDRVWNLDEEGSLDLSPARGARSFDFSPDSRQLLFGDENGMIRSWDLDRRIEVEHFSAHVGAASNVKLLADGRFLSSGNDGMVKIWRPRRPGVMQLKGYPAALRTLAFSPDSRWLAAAGIAVVVHIWDSMDGQLAGAYSEHDQQACAVAFSPEGRVASAGADQAVRVWNPVPLNTVWTHSIKPAEMVFWLVWSPDARRIYVQSRRDTVTVLDAATGERLNSISGLDNVLDGLAVSPDGQLLALCQKVNLSVRRAADLSELWHSPGSPLRCAAFSPDGKWIATGDLDGAVSLWEVASGGRVRRTLRGHGASVSGVSFHPDGSRLVSCGFDGLAKVWDWKAGVELLTLPLPGHTAAWHAVFSPDGKTIAAAGGNGIVTLWKTE